MSVRWETTPWRATGGAATAKPLQRRGKRSIDIVSSIVGLVLLSPLFAFVAWRISRESGDQPILFRQTRLGHHQRPFEMLKFRTLTVGTSSDAHEAYIAAAMRGESFLNEGRPQVYKLDYGDSVTPTGRWLRRTSIDELPQLLNVLRGEMSLVGPRPCIPYEVGHMKPHHLERFEVPAGMTGLWQVRERGRVSFADALELDVEYARNWSLMLDLRLLLKTLKSIFRSDERAL
jgi:lipopolysaccharide/colanic/teichoic acid biosynthesis glycosyltransferase